MSEVATGSLPPQNAQERRRQLRILAKSVFKELKAGGYDRKAMLGFTNELLDLVTSEAREENIADAE